MKYFLSFLFLSISSLQAQTFTIDLKLAEVNTDSTQARFFQGEPAYGLADAFGAVKCWGPEERDALIIQVEKTQEEYYALFNSTAECKRLIKKAKGFMGLNYGTIRFSLDAKTQKLISWERL